MSCAGKYRKFLGTSIYYGTESFPEQKKAVSRFSLHFTDQLVCFPRYIISRNISVENLGYTIKCIQANPTALKALSKLLYSLFWHPR